MTNILTIYGRQKFGHFWITLCKNWTSDWKISKKWRNLTPLVLVVHLYPYVCTPLLVPVMGKQPLSRQTNVPNHNTPCKKNSKINIWTRLLTIASVTFASYSCPWLMVQLGSAAPWRDSPETAGCQPSVWSVAGARPAVAANGPPLTSEGTSGARHSAVTNAATCSRLVPPRCWRGHGQSLASR